MLPGDACRSQISVCRTISLFYDPLAIWFDVRIHHHLLRRLFEQLRILKQAIDLAKAAAIIVPVGNPFVRHDPFKLFYKNKAVDLCNIIDSQNYFLGDNYAPKILFL